MTHYETVTKFEVTITEQPWAVNEEAARKGAINSGRLPQRSNSVQVEVLSCEVRELAKQTVEAGPLLHQLSVLYSDETLLNLARQIERVAGRRK
ncbi:hypothetical protein SEA_SUIGENERIS_52 [Mycobacterium phage Suigeneris]|uniref:Uncharacterized protein n=1 Tax=Mycobacterium phage Suigeneris TaxID=2776881 RepID=A0A7M1CP87_9CAUD|nr:hypothetical protein SEA_SUIGENERIS_52 [Mycobacterium phage Suigeneris]WUT94821.1 hypothetical protein PRODRIGUEZ_51 [Mycobacterium phage PRodriguez]